MRGTVRVLSIAFVGLVLGAAAAPAADPHAPTPPAAGKGGYRGECRRITKQIAHYARVVDRARERKSELWEEHTLQHIGRLSERRVRLCPEYAKKSYGKELVALLRLAAKVAVTVFTMGLL